MERRLSTILASDVVAFSKMMGSNEEGTLELLRERRNVLDEMINSYSGVIFGEGGDGVIAEFASPVKATECAMQIQGKMQVLNENVTDSEKMIFRVGINIGDVLVSDNNIFGDAVNVAARLESAAQPAGICISQSVFDMINQKINLSFEDAGELDLKNINHPVHAYNVLQPKAGGRYVKDIDAPRAKVDRAEAGSLAVMLFKNLSNDDEQAYFCEGFSEDLISTLSRFRKLLVVSGNASFAYRDKPKSPREIGLDLGVRYILEGSVRKLGPKIRISATLISADRENTVWSNNFDTTLEDIFDIQDELVEMISSTIVGRVEADAIQHLTTSRPENFDAYDLVLKGLEHHRKSGVTQKDAETAFKYFEKAIAVEPAYARAHAWRACSLANVNSWKSTPVKDWFSDCMASATQALEIDENDPEGHRIMGAIKWAGGDFDLARYHHERAHQLCPSDAFILARYAGLLIYLGEPETALEMVERAMRIDPFCPDFLFEDEGMCHFWMENLGSSVESFKKLKVPTRNSLFYLAAAFWQVGEQDKAKEALTEAKVISGLDVDRFCDGEKYQESSLREKLRGILEAVPE